MEHDAPLVRAEDATGEVAPPPVWMFGLLVLPYAVYANGFVNTVVAALLTAEGVPLDRVADIVAAIVLPTTLYFMWSPLVDFWMRRRTWVAVASAVAGLLMAIALQVRSLAAVGPRTLLFPGDGGGDADVVRGGRVDGGGGAAGVEDAGLGIFQRGVAGFWGAERWGAAVAFAAHGAQFVWRGVCGAGGGGAGVAGAADCGAGRDGQG